MHPRAVCLSKRAHRERKKRTLREKKRTLRPLPCPVLYLPHSPHFLHTFFAISHKPHKWPTTTLTSRPSTPSLSSASTPAKETSSSGATLHRVCSISIDHLCQGNLFATRSEGEGRVSGEEGIQVLVTNSLIVAAFLWYCSVGIQLTGVEYSALPSGLHTAPQDVM